MTDSTARESESFGVLVGLIEVRGMSSAAARLQAKRMGYGEEMLNKHLKRHWDINPDKEE